MKKIILLSLYLIICATQFSCTADTVETSPSANKVRPVADDPNNPIPPIRP
jgi:hypothetical protein